MKLDLKKITKSKYFLPGVIAAAVLIIGIVFLIIGLSGGEESVKWGDFELTENKDGTYTVVKYNGNDEVEEVMLPDFVNGKAVSAIGDSVFKNRKSLKRVFFSETLKSIGASAFEGCENLEAVLLVDGVETIGIHAFSGCSSLSDVFLSEELKSIGKYAFYECGSIKRIKLHGKVTVIEAYAFADCTALQSIVIPDSVKTVGRNAFSGCSSMREAVIGEAVESIGKFAFDKCNDLVSLFYAGGEDKWGSVTVEEGNGVFDKIQISFTLSTAGLEYTEKADGTLAVSGIGGAVDTVLKIPSVHNGKRVSEIANNAFSGNTDIIEVIIAEGVDIVGARAFFGCLNLRNAVIPSSVQSIGEAVFARCNELEAIELPFAGAYCGAMGKSSLFGYIFLSDSEAEDDDYQNLVLVIQNDGEMDHSFYFPSGLKSVTLNSDAAYSYGFFGCSVIENVVFTGNVSEIGNSLFRGCENLKEIKFNEGLRTVGANAFYGCKALTKINIPEGVVFIGEYAFYDCDGVLEITLPKSLLTIEKFAFDNLKSIESVRYNATLAEDVEEEYEQRFGRDDYDKIEKPFILYIGNEVREIPKLLFYASEFTEVVFETGSKCGKIRDFGFFNMLELERIELPDTVTEIGEKAFYNCQSLEAISIPDSVTALGNGAFGLCEGLKSYELGKGIVAIPDECFWSCDALTEIIVPDGVVSVGDNAFACDSAEKIVIGKSVKEIGESAFYGMTRVSDILFNSAVGEELTYGAHWLYECGIEAEKTSLVIGGDVTAIPAGFLDEFQYTDIDSLEFVKDSACRKIGDRAFGALSELRVITLSENITDIGENVFDSSYYVEEIYLNSKEILNVKSSLVRAWNPSYSLPLTVYVGKDVTVIPSNIFADFYTLERVVFEEGSVCGKIGDSAFSSCINLTDINLPNGITEIGNSAFRECSGITGINLGPSLKTVGEYAFFRASGLKSLTIPESVEFIGYSAFSECEKIEIFNYNARNLENVQSVFGADFESSSGFKLTVGSRVEVIPDRLFESTAVRSIDFAGNSVIKRIGDYAFQGCRLLEKVTLPKSLKQICHESFFACTSLKDIYLYSEELTCDNDGIFTNTNTDTGITVHVGNTVKSIPDYLFSDSMNSYRYVDVREIVFEEGSSCTSVGNGAFENCKNLAGAAFPESLREIGYSAFSGCTAFSLIQLPEGVLSVGDFAFDGCELPQNIIVPGTVEYIGNNAFGDILPESYTAYGDACYVGNSENPYMILFRVKAEASDSLELHPDVKFIYTEVLKECEGLKQLTLPKGITFVKKAFYRAEVIETVVLPDGLKEIPDSLFEGCSSLKNVNIPDGVEKIGEAAFYSCQSLETVYIPDSVTSIGRGAFDYCSALKEVRMSSNIEHVGVDAFSFAPVKTVNYKSGYYIGNEANPYLVLHNVSYGVGAIHPDTRIIGPRAFDSTSVTEIIIPDKVVSIEYWAFYNTSSLETLHIGASVKNIYNNALEKTPMLQAITVDPLNAYFKAVDGNLYSKDGTAFVKYCSAKTESAFTLPETVTKINSYAFFQSDNLESISFPATVTEIENYAIYECGKITELIIPDGVTEVECVAYGCKSLKLVDFGKGITEVDFWTFFFCSQARTLIIDTSVNTINFEYFSDYLGDSVVIYYTGTEEEWNKIDKSLVPFVGYTVIYNYVRQ